MQMTGSRYLTGILFRSAASLEVPVMEVINDTQKDSDEKMYRLQ